MVVIRPEGSWHYRLRSGLTYCVDAQRVVFLDISRNRYFTLAGDANTAFIEFCERGFTGSNQATGFDKLLLAGVLEPDPFVRFEPLTIPKPHSALTPFGQSSLPDKLSAIHAQYGAMINLWREPLEMIVQTMKNRRARSLATLAPPTPGPSWAALASAFRATQNLRPKAAHCLTSSLAFLKVGFSRNLNAQLVFGVQAAPFLAHCWVESEGVILNDELEFVSCFTPILVI
jgi:hypothetical protein